MISTPTIKPERYDVPVRFCRTCGILYQGYWCPRCGVEKTLRLRKQVKDFNEMNEGKKQCKQTD